MAGSPRSAAGSWYAGSMDKCPPASPTSYTSEIEHEYEQLHAVKGVSHAVHSMPYANLGVTSLLVQWLEETGLPMLENLFAQKRAH